MGTMDKNSIVRQLKEVERRYLSLFEFHTDAVFEICREGRMLKVNPASSAMSGYSREELLQMETRSLIVEEDKEKARYYYQRVLQGHYDQFELTVLHKDSRKIYIQCTTIPIEMNGRIEAFFTIVKDMTEQREAKQQINQMSNYDVLTGLPNRRLFLKRLEQLGSSSFPPFSESAVMNINLDRFKFINESLGYAIGELLLQHISSLLRQLFRSDATVARMDADEFAVLLPNITGKHEALSYAEALTARLTSPIVLEGLEVVISASIGIVLMNGSRASEASIILRESDVAMRHVKKNQSELRYAIYSESMDSQVTYRLQLESGLRNAIRLNQMFLRYQPIVNVRTGAIEAVEALLRWNHPDLGFISPVEFIPVAEETGEIIAIGSWVLRTACRQICQWHREGLHLRIGVNVSLMQLQEPGFPELVQSVLDEVGLESRWLDIEVTEGILIQDQEKIKEQLSALRALGVHISIDDFGTGYTSLNYLKTFPIDYLKIDRSFIKDINHDLNNNIILACLIDLAHCLDIQVIGEGIETPEHMDFLKSKGCDEGQGYLISAAVDAEEICKLYSKYKKAPDPHRFFQ
jgi:diguanylate cyclase (GGDEF)-like protein/PAS domain S-box-containing protein